MPVRIVIVLLPLRWWPLGGWAVYDGWLRTAEGAWIPFSDEESIQLW